MNERDALGDNLVPDYITHVEANGFYGWPWWYMGGTQDPRQKGKHPELKDRVITPDVLIQPHNASLEMLFYEGEQFPGSYRGDIFAAEHGSWNREMRTGYEVIRVAMNGGARAANQYEDFLTGFVTPEGEVWGRPVGVAVAADGSLLVSDDAGEVIWRVSRDSRAKNGAIAPALALHLGDPLRRFQNLARLGAVGRTDDAVALHQVDEVGGASVADAQAALDAGKWRPCRTRRPGAPHRCRADRCRRRLPSSPPSSFTLLPSSLGAARKPCSYCAVACAFQNSTVEAISFSVTNGAWTRSTREEPLGR